MKILGIESSCDETAAAVIEDGSRLLSNVVQSQINIHAKYGGVIPEIAARSHLEAIHPVVDKALSDAECTWNDIDAIAVTYAPGLIGSLLVGSLTARTLAIIHDKPLYPVHHIEAHVYANFIVEQKLSDGLPASEHSDFPSEFGQDKSVVGDPTKPLILPSKQPEFPMLALIVSGGHTQLMLFHGHGDYELLGQTRDDAVGEAFDKVGKILGFPYPGAVEVDRAADRGDRHKYHFPIAKLDSPYDFSFSGLKTAVLRAAQSEVGKDHTFPSYELPAALNDVQRDNLAASFQTVAVETLVGKTEAAFHEFQPRSVIIAGGVAACQYLRDELQRRIPINIEYAPMKLCTDNAAMVGALGYYISQNHAPTDPYDVEVLPNLSMAKTAQPRGAA